MKFRLFLKSRWRLVLLICLLILVVPFVFSRLAGHAHRVEVLRNMNVLVKSISEPKESIRIASYNIAHGRGLAESNHAGGDRAERTERLNQIAQLLREIDADIVVLNEVDFDASWSYGVNQAQYLAEQAGYSHWVEQRNLDFRVLTWTWRFGNAVLSKHPIRRSDLIQLPAYEQWESWLVGQKQGLVVEIEFGKQTMCVIATHLEHRSETTRTASVRAILKTIAGFEQRTILVGDLNSTPTGFPHSTTDDQGDNALDLLDHSRRFRREPPQEPAADQFTFHSQSPDRVIDWILVPADWNFQNYSAIDSALSDHRPIVADISIR